MPKRPQISMTYPQNTKEYYTVTCIILFLSKYIKILIQRFWMEKKSIKMFLIVCFLETLRVYFFGMLYSLLKMKKGGIEYGI